jgi:hypothetical protein
MSRNRFPIRQMERRPGAGRIQTPVGFPSGITARRFDGVDDFLTTSIGSCNLSGALTVAALFRRRDPGLSGRVVANGEPGFVLRMQFGWNASDQVFFSTTGAGRTSTVTISPQDGWVIVAVTKAAGTVTPRAHIYKGGAWAHENLSGTVPDPTADQANVHFATNILAVDAVDIAVAGEWTSELSDGNVETLSANRLTQDWADLSPQGLWDFNQASIATPLTDLIGTADETAITGTEVIDDGPPAWAFGAAAEAIVPLDPASGVSSATLALTAPTQVPLDLASGASSATLALTAPALLSLTATGASSATLALSAPTFIPLDPASCVSSATLDVSTPGAAEVPLDAASGVASATLFLTAPTLVPLGATSATSSATLALSAPALLGLAGATSTASATLALSAQTTVLLDACAGVASASLDLYVPSSTVPLEDATCVSSATLALSAQTRVPLGTATCTSSATLALSAPALLTLSTADGTSAATLVLRALTTIPLGTVTATSSGTLLVTARTQVPLGASSGLCTATLSVFAPGFGDVLLNPASAVATATLVVDGLDTAWAGATETNWPGVTQSRWLGSDDSNW